jgi:hypothetical protein
VRQDNSPSRAGPNHQSCINTLPAQQPNPTIRQVTSSQGRWPPGRHFQLDGKDRSPSDLLAVRCTIKARMRRDCGTRRMAQLMEMRMCDTVIDAWQRAPVAGDPPFGSSATDYQSTPIKDLCQRRLRRCIRRDAMRGRCTLSSCCCSGGGRRSAAYSGCRLTAACAAPALVWCVHRPKETLQLVA